VFQVDGVDARGGGVIRKQPRRSQVLPFFEKLDWWLVGIEACAAAHHWAPQLMGLSHEARPMPPPYVKRGKNDAADAGVTYLPGARSDQPGTPAAPVPAMRPNTAPDTRPQPPG